MQNITVLGAGYMGSAITFPLSDSGNKVNLWGTWLDDEMIESSLKGFHPKLKKSLPENVNLYYWQDLGPALEDSEIIFIGITSEGFVNVFKMLLEHLNPQKNYYFFKLTKGLVEYNNKIIRATEAAYDMFAKKFPDKSFYWTSVGGPVKAIDLSYRMPSASMYGISDDKIKSILSDFSTDYYRIFHSNDLKGVETCSMLKNIYSMAAGICDGIYKKESMGLYYNAVSFIFNQSVLEIAKIIRLSGCRQETVLDLAGVGDLHVTSSAGRNRRYGEMVGSGIEGETAFKQMCAEGEYGEGYIALKLVIPWITHSFNEASNKDFIKNELPLLYTLNNIIYGKDEPASELKKLISKLGS
jgi:glycerol-3-phosphate dehydrogenase (NAD(P)+)